MPDHLLQHAEGEQIVGADGRGGAPVGRDADDLLGRLPAAGDGPCALATVTRWINPIK